MLDIWRVVPTPQDMCSTCRMTTSKPVQTYLGNCRTTTWCPPPSFRSIAPVRGPPAALPSSPNSLTAAMVSFRTPDPQENSRGSVMDEVWSQSKGHTNWYQRVSPPTGHIKACSQVLGCLLSTAFCKPRVQWLLFNIMSLSGALSSNDWIMHSRIFDEQEEFKHFF